MKILLTAHVNGEEREALGDTRDTLLELLRDRLGLTGTKEGCGNGNCGSCTVLMDGVPVNACLVLAQEAAGARIETIEGVASPGMPQAPGAPGAPGALGATGRLDRVQAALVEHGGTQCGFCTPGIVMTARGLLAATPQPTEDQIRAAIAGNLCRCTGYDKIVRAIAAAACAPREA